MLNNSNGRDSGQATMPKEFDYMSFLLRLWRVNTEGQFQWRASLESVQNGERLNFAHLAQLFEFLEEQTLKPSQACCDPASANGSNQ